MRITQLVIYYLFMYPFVVLYHAGYYIRQYFVIKSIVSSRLEEHALRSAVYLNHSMAKLLIATTYVSLTAKLLSDIINNKKSKLTCRREFVALIDLYFLVVITDNFIDNDVKKNKEEKINETFKKILFLIENPDDYSKIKISHDFDSEIGEFIKTYRDLWKNEYRDEFKKSINLVRRAYLSEATSHSSLKKSWQSLYRISRVTVTLYESINYFIYNKKIPHSYIKTNLYNFAFSGNVIDDWMDYYWTKEDVGSDCFLVQLSLHHGLKHAKGWVFNLITFMSSFYLLSKRLSKVRINTIQYAKYSWIMPAFIIVTIVSSPISVWTHLREK